MRSTTIFFKNKDMQEFRDDCLERTELVLERIEWLLDGNYGYDEMISITNVLERPRMNHNAIIFQAIAKYEWRLNQAQANKVYNTLNQETQDKLNTGITEMLPETEAQRLANGK